ncbi:3173_t:CDS:2, partial [Racocetra fulgida]
DGHWEGTCKFCEKFYSRAKPNTLRAHLANSCKNISEEWRRHFNYILVNNLEDIPTDEPLYGMPNSTLSVIKGKKADKQLTNWFDSHTFAERMIQHANKITKFFKKSHRAAAVLNQKILQYQISGGGLKTYDIQENHSEIINPAILIILHSRGFFSDMQYLSDVLLPIKDAILSIEANRSTLADCYINLIKIAAAIQNLLANEYKGFRNDCIKKFKNQFEEFNDPAYQLAYFLHPAYKGQMGKNKESCEVLIMQLRWYKEQEQYINGVPNPYIAPYTIGSDTPL